MRLFSKSPDIPVEAPAANDSMVETTLQSVLAELQSIKAHLPSEAPRRFEPDGRVWGEVQETLFQKLQYPLLRDLILFYDRMAKSVVGCAEAAPEDMLATVRTFPEELRDLLGEHGVETLELGERLDPDLHQTTRVLETDDPARHHQIARIVREGFQVHGRVLRKTEVEVYRFTSGGPA